MVNYNITINSNNAVGGTNSSDYVYNFNWENLEEGDYELTFNFSSELDPLINDKVVVSCPDLGVCSNSFTTSSLTAQKFSGVIGSLYSKDIATSIQYVVPSTFNPPVYLKTRPYSNQFTVYLKDLDGNLVDIGVSYVIILSLKKL